jgi:hypothetical protein
MTNRPLYVRKYHSGRLKEFDYSIENTYNESKNLKEIIGLSDSQMLRTIREIRKHTINRNQLEIRIKTRDHYKYNSSINKKKTKYYGKIIEILNTRPNTDNNLINRLRNKYLNNDSNDKEFSNMYYMIQEKIDRTMFIEDYVVVVMDNLKQYEYLYNNGFYINGKLYRRLSCSAGQARVSTVIFCNVEIINRVKEILDNGRNEKKKFSPSKYNAYFGLYGSATHVVSEPKFIVVKDYINTTSFDANYVIENGWNVDDTIIPKKITNMPMNRTDGMGLISYRQAEKWSKELGLEYVPSQFCIRQSFIKGMLCVFPIHDFCEEINSGNYMVDTIYKDEQGEYIKADIRDYDVILSESQFKLWDSYSSIDEYIDNCHKNKLYWGVSLYTPKEAKKMMKMNYQFIQTLKLSKKDIEDISNQFVKWITGVSYDNIYYMLLFLLGVNNDENKIKQFLFGSDNYWIKSLIINHELKNDKFIRTKIRNLIKKKIEGACKGDIYIDGNFEVIVSDPYGFMQHVCNLPVTGLLKKDEFYSNYWNMNNIKQIDSMRSPLTYLSEHVIMNLIKNDETEKWYRYCKLGIILNYHGHESVNLGGCDFDFDILATVSHEKIRNGVYKNELPVVYDAPKPEKKIFNEHDLYLSDTFSFGSIIGSITNKSSNAYALLPVIEELHGLNSQEYRLIKSRLQQCCKAQSAQIDKAKIGRPVKGIPKVWVNYTKLPKKENKLLKCRKLKKKQLYNKTLLDKYPYFFRYVYSDTNRQYKKYIENHDMTCKQKFKKSLKELECQIRKTTDEMGFIESFYRYSPVTHSNSSMNLLCKYIESINFNISEHIKSNTFDMSSLYKNNTLIYKDVYYGVVTALNVFNSSKTFENNISQSEASDEDEYNDEKIKEFKHDSDTLFDALNEVCKNPYLVVNCLVDYYYIEKPSSNKELLWATYGKYMFKNIVRNTNSKTVLFPFPSINDDIADISYLGYDYSLKEVNVNEL